MTREEYDNLEEAVPLTPMVSASELTDKSDRTLLWGYTCDRRSWHVYLRNGVIELYVYGRGWFGEDFSPDHMSDECWPIEQLIPGKRLYPDACDAEFCRILRTKGAFLPFTTFNDKREPKQFHGELPQGEVAA